MQIVRRWNESCSKVLTKIAPNCVMASGKDLNNVCTLIFKITQPFLDTYFFRAFTSGEAEMWGSQSLIFRPVDNPVCVGG